ncbi:MAG: tetratricopeptide repeat protein [Luteibacter sp.]
MNFALRQLPLAGMLLFAVSAHAGDVQILSATIKDQPIAGATVILQKNGEASVGVQTDASGRAPLAAGYTDDAQTLVLVKKDGYSTLVAKCPCQGMTYALSPVMHNLDGMRIVLTWGKHPTDLDSHISYPGNHIYFSHKTGTDANLDVDDTTSYGPETITLERKHEGETYVYSVHDYVDRDDPRSTELSDSQAKVFVYIGQSLVRTYYVPTEKQGNLWTVFRVTGEGEFQDINAMSGMHGALADGNTASGRYGNDTTQVTNANGAVADPVRAKQRNLTGEAAYKAGRLDDAIAAFQEATQLDPAYGQAYANLGLAYQKADRSAEAIWADRKAIALASGANAATTRAGAYYNIGRLYENAGQSADALTNYRSARQEKANPVYDKAIERVSARQ